MPEPREAVRCFGGSDFEHALTRLDVPDAGIERQVGGPVVLPDPFPIDTSEVKAGLVPNALFPDGRPAYVVNFAGTTAAAVSGFAVFAEQPLCTLSPSKPEHVLDLDDRSLFAWIDDSGVAAGAHGIIEGDEIYVEIVLAWPKSAAPQPSERLEALQLFAGAFMPVE